MSLSEEKLLILKMLEEGKITGEEAAKLLEALENDSKQAKTDPFSKHQKQTTFQDRVHEWKKEFKSSDKHKDFDRAMDEFSSKAEKLGKNVAATTFSIVDKVVDFVGSFVDTNAFNFFGNCPIVEKNFETVAAPDMELKLEAINGHITVKKHSEDKIIIKSKIRSPKHNAENVLMYSQIGNLVSLCINKLGNISVSHEVFIPAIKFNKICLESSNGRIYVEDSISEALEVVTRDAHIELMGVNSQKVNVTTKNARIQISYVTGKNIEVNTNNSVIDIKHIKTESITAVTMNGRILVENAQNYENSPEMQMLLKTANGGIKVNMDDMDNRGYRVKAHTTNGSINVLIPEMVFNNINKQGSYGKSIEAQSNGYETSPAKVNITAETSNGYIEVVK